jgi:nucleotide-binding universal stress UspA family protein
MATMCYRNLLVCLEANPRSDERLEFALRLAAEHDAHLTALLIDYTPYNPRAKYGFLSPMIARFEEELQHHHEQARASFEQKARALGLDYGWATARQFELPAAVAYSRGFDLVIAGQYDPADEKGQAAETFPDQLLLGSGRPVLMYPAMGSFNADFGNIVVIWNGSREVARAVADAMPLLMRAEKVTMLTAAPPPRRHEKSTLQAPDIATQLQRHQVRAEHIVNPCAPNESDWLLTRAQGLEQRADLLVAGAYGHSRVGELVFGGVTRKLLQEMSIPVLMSH